MKKGKVREKMYRKILVPLDGSKRAEAIVPHVEQIAHGLEANVILLQVIEPVFVYASPYGTPGWDLEENKREALVNEAETYLAGIEGEFREVGISTKLLVEEGPIVGTIIDVAEKNDVDMIAMASHGRTGLSHVFYGSVAAGVLHRIDRPLLIIRAEGS